MNKTVRLIVGAISVVLIGILTYLLVISIQEPIKFEEIYNTRKAAVAQQLDNIRTAQEAYKSINGTKYAGTWEELKSVLSTQNFKIKKVFGDIDKDPDNVKIVIDEVSALDSLNALGIKLDSIEYIPYGNGKKFFLYADTITINQAKGIPVIEVSTYYKYFMAEYSSKKLDGKYMEIVTDSIRVSEDSLWTRKVEYALVKNASPSTSYTKDAVEFYTGSGKNLFVIDTTVYELTSSGSIVSMPTMDRKTLEGESANVVNTDEGEMLLFDLSQTLDIFHNDNGAVYAIDKSVLRSYKKFKNEFEPTKDIKFGNRRRPTTAGNWEK